MGASFRLCCFRFAIRAVKDVIVRIMQERWNTTPGPNQIQAGVDCWHKEALWDGSISRCCAGAGEPLPRCKRMAHKTVLSRHCPRADGGRAAKRDKAEIAPPPGGLFFRAMLGVGFAPQPYAFR